MANTLSIVNNFTALIDGNTYTGKQGDITSLIAAEFDVTLTTGAGHIVPGSLATATVVTVFDDDDDVPIDWVYFFIWTEVAMYVQIIGPSMDVVLKTQAKVPFSLGVDSLRARGVNDSGATVIAGGTEPTLSDIDSIVLGNYTGGTGKYLAAFFA